MYKKQEIKNKSKVFYIFVPQEELDLLYLRARPIPESHGLVQQHLRNYSRANSLRVIDSFVNPANFARFFKISIDADEDMVIFWLTMGDRVVRS